MKSLSFLAFVVALVAVTGMTLAIPDPSSAYCDEMGYAIVGDICDFGDGASCTLWDFYNGDCGENYVHDVDCAVAGEHSGVAVECCEGLTGLSNSFAGNDGLCADIIGGYPVCSDCGNGVCEDWENKCNCPLDCEEIICYGNSIIGDVNNDGEVTILDANLTMMVGIQLRQMPTNICCLDASKDGTLTAYDASLMMQVVEGLIDPLGTCNGACHSDDDCLENSFCSFDQCSAEKGTCTDAPEICTSDYSPVCGCDGKTYSNDCVRKAAKVSKNHDGECEALCTDSDGGKNYYRRGEAKDANNFLGDHCNDDGTLTEKFCENGEVKWEIYDCPYGCHNGACLSENVVCTDSDGGKDQYVKGYVSLENEKWYDKCYVPDYISGTDGKLEGGRVVDSCLSEELCFVNENYCSKPSWSTEYVAGIEWIRCQFGCKDGACITDIEQNLPPIIDSVSAPTILKVGERGTWTIKAHDPENGILSYKVNWGEKNEIAHSSEVQGPSVSTTKQTTSFTHSYNNAGTYTIAFTVTDNHNQAIRTTTTVNVKENILVLNVCCKIYGIGANMEKVNVRYEWTIKDRCSVPEGFTGGGKEIVDDSKCASRTCAMPICKDDSEPKFTGKYDSDKCPIYKCDISEDYYRYVQWECYDGLTGPFMPIPVPVLEEKSEVLSGAVAAGSGSHEDMNSVIGISTQVKNTRNYAWCKSRNEWKTEAEAFCEGHCSEESNKCGVNSFSVWGECTPEIDACRESDKGLDYYTRGYAMYKGIKYHDVCEYIPQAENEPSSMAYTLSEVFCTMNGVEKEKYNCPNGCKDGACIANPSAKCTDDLDCGKPEKTRYCSGDSACASSKVPQCTNAGTDDAQCTTVESGGCAICPNGCSDGKCLSGKCGDGVCEEGEKCDVDCCTSYCKLYCPNGYIEGSCHCECEEGDKKCSDSDGGKNYFTPGIAVGPGGSFFTDICDASGTILQEGFCTNNGLVSSERYSCQYGCENGACLQTTGDCNGCLEEGSCLPIGFRKGGKYCDIGNNMKKQKVGDDVCDNHHECSSNVCVNNKCVSPSFIETIIQWFSSLFGG